MVNAGASFHAMKAQLLATSLPELLPILLVSGILITFFGVFVEKVSIAALAILIGCFLSEHFLDAIFKSAGAEHPKVVLKIAAVVIIVLLIFVLLKTLWSFLKRKVVWFAGYCCGAFVFGQLYIHVSVFADFVHSHLQHIWIGRILFGMLFAILFALLLKSKSISAYVGSVVTSLLGAFIVSGSVNHLYRIHYGGWLVQYWIQFDALFASAKGLLLRRKEAAADETAGNGDGDLSGANLIRTCACLVFTFVFAYLGFRVQRRLQRGRKDKEAKAGSGSEAKTHVQPVVYVAATQPEIAV